eukprot:Em0021g774a
MKYSTVGAAGSGGSSGTSPGNTPGSTPGSTPGNTPGKTNGISGSNGTSVSASAFTPQQKTVRDSSWLELEVCRDYQRMSCPRSPEQCRFAHPEQAVLVKDGRVTCCYDFLKDRCMREKCRYFHPPAHIKDRLVMAGKHFGMMMSAYPSMAFQPCYPVVMMPQSPISPVYDGPVPLSPFQVPVMGSEPYGPPLSPYGMLSDRLYVCLNAVRGQCNDHNCGLVHPEPHVRRNPDHTITVCKDFMRGDCHRDQCRYCHPPPHIVMQMVMGVGAALVPPPFSIPVSMGPHVTPMPQMFIPLCSPVLGPQSAGGTTFFPPTWSQSSGLKPVKR